MSTHRLFIGIFLLALVALTTKNATDPDFGWHLKTGEYIVTHASIPHTDFFSFTATGFEWVTHEWLTQVIMYFLYQTGGFFALILFFALATALTFWLLYLRCDGQPYFAAFIVLFAALAAAPIWGIRPQTIALLLTSAFLYVLDRYRRKRNPRVLLWLPLLMLLWANAHGSFALGPFLILIYLLGDLAEHILQAGKLERSAFTYPSARHLLLILVASTTIIVLNPNGIGLYPYPFQTLSSRVIQTYIQEWQPPNFHDPAVQPFAWMLVATLGVLAVSRRRLDIVQLLLLVGFTYATLRAARQISIWVLIAAPILCTALLELSALIPRKLNVNFKRRPSPLMSIVNTLFLGFVALAVLLRVTITTLDQARAERAIFPVAAVEWMQQSGLHGPIFNLYDWGGYLIWKLYPNERVFIDGRSDLYSLTGDQVVTEYLTTVQGGTQWSDALEKYRVALVLIQPNTPLATLLGNDGRWKQMYVDTQALIFVRQ